MCDSVPETTADSSDNVLVGLLRPVKASSDAKEIRQISRQIGQVVFHKQFENAWGPEAPAAGDHGSPCTIS